MDDQVPAVKERPSRRPRNNDDRPAHRRLVAPTTARLTRREGFLTRSDLAALGLERRAVDAVFRELPVVSFPGYSRPLIRVQDYLDLVERSTYRGDRIRPTRSR